MLSNSLIVPGGPANGGNRCHRAIRLLVVDDHVVCCVGLVGLFQNAHGIGDVVGATDAEEAVGVAKRFRPRAVLMDVTLPNCGAFWAARRILDQCPPTRVIFLDDRVRAAHVRESLRIGGAGYWTKHASFEQLAEAVRSAVAGGVTCCPEVDLRLHGASSGFRSAPDGPRLAKLSNRELEVLSYVAQGLTVTRCAEQMGLARSTVDNHKWRLMKKLGLHKTAELVRFAIREGLVPG